MISKAETVYIQPKKGGDKGVKGTAKGKEGDPHEVVY